MQTTPRPAGVAPQRARLADVLARINDHTASKPHGWQPRNGDKRPGDTAHTA